MLRRWVKYTTAPVWVLLFSNLVMSQTIDLPPLPGGLPSGGVSIPSQPAEFEDDFASMSPWTHQGFLELSGGMRLHDDAVHGRSTLSEVRAQWELDFSGDQLTARMRADVVQKWEHENKRIALNQGQGPIDLREAWLQKSPLAWLDVKAGRQILTWGVGDLLFINDLFPKDWQSFLLGRDTEYLKAPSDAMKFSVFNRLFNMDLVWSPEFDSDRYVSGEYLSYFNSLTGQIAGKNAMPPVEKPTDWEWAIRLYRSFKGVELAGYGYKGYWKNPVGYSIKHQELFFPRLVVVGGSARSDFSGGIVSSEWGWYQSLDDRKGVDPLVPNSQFRGLVAYERELAPQLTGSVQYYVERMADYSKYRASLMNGQVTKDKTRQLITLRLTRQTHQQAMTWSLFTFYSPTDQDFYLRPQWTYNVSDRWRWAVGANVFGGQQESTFFGQFEENSSVYASIRYSY